MKFWKKAPFHKNKLFTHCESSRGRINFHDRSGQKSRHFNDLSPPIDSPRHISLKVTIIADTFRHLKELNSLSDRTFPAIKAYKIEIKDPATRSRHCFYNTRLLELLKVWQEKYFFEIPLVIADWNQWPLVGRQFLCSGGVDIVWNYYLTYKLLIGNYLFSKFFFYGFGEPKVKR